MTISIALLVALVLYLFSIVLAVWNRETSPTYFAVMAGVTYYLLSMVMG